MKVALPCDVLTIGGYMLTITAEELIKCEFIQAKEESIAKGKCFIIFHDNDHCYQIKKHDYVLLNEAKDMVAYDMWEDRMKK